MKCLLCGKEINDSGSFMDLLFHEDSLCSSCRHEWIRRDQNFRIDGVKASSTWVYNDAFSKALIQFKECGDEALKDIFLQPVRRTLSHRYKGYTLLLMPSTQEKRRERGFSHLMEMYESLGLEMMEPFINESRTAQKKLSRSQRLSLQHEIHLKPGVSLPRKILLADDVMTTGSTLKGALHCIDPNQHDIRIFVCARVERRK